MRQPCRFDLLLGGPKGRGAPWADAVARTCRETEALFRDPLADLDLQAEDEHEGLVDSP